MSSGVEAARTKIIVADDSRTYRNIIINTLSAMGYREENIYTADSGTAVLRILDEHTIDFFLLDWNMPQPNGIELVRTIRSSERYVDTPVVMITSEAARYNVLEAIRAGVSDYLTKPIAGKSLEEKLKKYLKTRAPL